MFHYWIAGLDLTAICFLGWEAIAPRSEPRPRRPWSACRL